MTAELAPVGQYQIGLSFAGEDREIVHRVAEALRERGVAVFYDRYEEAHLLGKNLQEYLSELYANRCQYCAVFISEAYLRSEWTKLERQSMQETALRSHNEYLLPIRIDDSALPGLSRDVAYFDLRQRSWSELVEVLCAKLGVETEPQSPHVGQRLVELMSDSQFRDQGDMDMHNLHATIVRRLGGHRVSIVGCLPDPHRVQLEMGEAAYSALRKSFLDGSLNNATMAKWLGMSSIERVGPIALPWQVPAVTSAGGVSCRHVVCHLGTIQGWGAEGRMGYHYLGWNHVEDIQQIRAVVVFREDGVYVHTNFLKSGYKHTTKVYCESEMDLFDFLINSVFRMWPTDDELRKLKYVHEHHIQYLLIHLSGSSPGEEFYRGAMNLRFVSPVYPTDLQVVFSNGVA